MAVYCEVCVSAVCLSVREHISGTKCPIFANFLHVKYGRPSVLLWQGCDILFTSDFIDEVMFAHQLGVHCMKVT